MPRFNALAQVSQSPEGQEGERPKKARRKAQGCCESELVQAAARVPVATLLALAEPLRVDPARLREDFIAFCRRHSSEFKDWRVAWNAFFKATEPVQPPPSETQSPVTAQSIGTTRHWFRKRLCKYPTTIAA